MGEALLPARPKAVGWIVMWQPIDICMPGVGSQYLRMPTVEFELV